MQFVAIQTLRSIMNKEELSRTAKVITVKTGQGDDWPFVLFKNQKDATARPAGD